MQVERRRLWMIVWAALLVSMALFVGRVASSRAQEVSPDAWALRGPGGPVSHLFTPASGALFASAPSGLFRSDDGGVTWRQVSLPDGAYLAEVDPTDHTVLYA